MGLEHKPKIYYFDTDAQECAESSLNLMHSDGFLFFLWYVSQKHLNTIQTDAWTNVSLHSIQFSDFDDVIRVY